MPRFDTVVVGGGAGGSVVAARLSEDPARTVLLIEAGATPRATSEFPAALLDASRVPGAEPRPGEHWSYPVRLTSGTATTIFRGRGLGGSTTTNGGYFVRARRADFDAWAAAGNPDWAYQRVLPLLRAMETDHDYGDSALHGGSGPMPVRRPALRSPAAVAFTQAAAELGFTAEPDKNDQGEPGVGPVPMNVQTPEGVPPSGGGSVRWNTALAYVLPALGRPNLTVLGHSTALRIRFRGRRVVGVQLLVDGRPQEVDADEVVLCAGAFETPRLLLRSGVGPRSELHRLGVPPVCDLPGVGRRFSDHPQVVVEWSAPGDLSGGEMGWLAAGLNFSSTGGPAGGDLQVLQSTVPMTVLTGHPAPQPGGPLPLLVSVHTPQATGRLRLPSADPEAAMDIDYRYLTTALDRSRMREAVRAAVALVNTRAFGAVEAIVTGLDTVVVGDDAALDGWISARLGTTQHACGTAPMGPESDPDAVVDQHGRVHRAEGLHIADTSILPTAPLRGPAATAVLIGELVARALRVGPRTLPSGPATQPSRPADPAG